jgi:hypothetical protein
VVWYGVAAMPVLAEGLARLGPGSERRATSSAPPWAQGALAALILVPVLLVQPWFRPGMELLAHTPVAAVEYLRRHPGGRLFNEVGYGSYLTWALPDQPVFVDGRIELFPAAVWEDYNVISSGRGAVAALERYGIERVLLSLEFQAPLSTALGASGRWDREYADGEAEVWRRIREGHAGSRLSRSARGTPSDLADARALVT